MKWFKHETTTANPKIKLLKKKHGAVGYAVYFQIVELVAERVEPDNQPDWGILSPVYTNDYDFLAEELGTDAQTLQNILETCFSLNLLTHQNGLIICKQVLERADEYTQRLINKKQPKPAQSLEETQTKSDKVPTVSRQSRTKNRIDKNRIEENIKASGHSLTGLEVSLMDELPESEMRSISERKKVSLETVASYKEQYVLWIKKSPKKRERWNLSMKNHVLSWLARDISSGKIQQKKSTLEQIKEVYDFT